VRPSGAVVFDFDGVLADTERLHLLAFQEAFRARGWELTDAAYFDRYLGFDDRDLVRAFTIDQRVALRPDDEDALVAAKARAYEAQVARGSVLFPGAAPAVARLGARFKLGIASGSLRAEIVHILGPDTLAPAFHAIVGADDVTRSKPAPDLYLAALDRLDVLASRAVAIEDSRWGLAAARAAGLRTIAVTTSYPAATLTSADRVVASLDDITVGTIQELIN
jgi:HAD superfamily hydrolase (TIGR01509 family)